MDGFRTVEVSDAAYEQEGLRFITAKSRHLKGRGDVCLFVPGEAGVQPSLPVTILLHGVYGSAWNWPLKTGVHRMAAEMIGKGLLAPMVLAMPSDGLWGDGSAY